MSSSKRRDVEKERYWRKTIRDAGRSGLSIRAYCRRHKLKESQFHWWQRTLKSRDQKRSLRGPTRRGGTEGQTRFALVSEEPEDLDAGIELVLGDGCRIRIGKGVDEETLRTVLAAVGTHGYAGGA